MTEGSEFVLMGVALRCLVSGEATGGSFCLFENSSDGPTRTPIHVHQSDDETLYVLEGEMQAIVAGAPTTLNAGEAIFLPRGVPHQLMNASGRPTRYLLLCTPSVFESFLAEAGRLREPNEKPPMPTPEDVERVKAAAPNHGITLLPGW